MLRTSSYGLWLSWLLSTCIGSTLAFTLAEIFLNYVDNHTSGYYEIFFYPIAVVIVGGFIGFSQWITLRISSNESILWIPATAIGLLLGIFVGISVSTVLSGTSQWINTLVIFGVAGMFTSMLQWISLRREFIGFYKWILVSGIGWGIGMFFVWNIILHTSFGSFSIPVSGFLSGSIIGILSGGFVKHTLLSSLPEDF